MKSVLIGLNEIFMMHVFHFLSKKLRMLHKMGILPSLHVIILDLCAIHKFSHAIELPNTWAEGLKIRRVSVVVFQFT